ncbi:hypothetical protein ABZU76_05670 [Amycolatopsis sp. NPDC005232]|uniref:hypothetical protein n=1 Tax=Amycolatopsis sp. NPDC005232 TaxID=3157027 RepID=UPI0033A5A54D
MSVAEFRIRLAAVAQQLPASELADACHKVDLVHGQLRSAWYTSDHVSSQAALVAAAAAVEQLKEIVTGLEDVAAGIDRYTAQL